jgi:DNA-binding NarL/FixJ family response regulator
VIRVLVADDHAMVRSGFRMILEHEPDLTVVGEATTGDEAVALARELRPDVVLMDIRMPGTDGLEATRQLAGRDVADPLRVVVVTTFDLDEYVHTALRDGASGFLLENAGPALLVEGVRAAAAGDVLVSPALTARLLARLTTPASRPPDRPLSGRETAVAKLVARGRTNAEIATELFVSVSTVKTHLLALQQKLGVRNRVEIAAWAWETGTMAGS